VRNIKLRVPGYKTLAALLALGGLLLAVLGIVGVYLTTFPGVTVKRVTFDTVPYDDPPRTVSGLLFIPERPADDPTPAVIFCHGLTVHKEVYVSHCRELARRGLIVLDIDLRGHGSTGGTSDFGNTEMRDVWAAADYLACLEGVDGERIGVTGHSLGGITSTRAGIFQEDDTITAVAAIYCWPGQEQAIELVLGPVDDFIGRLWPQLAWSRRYDINDKVDAAERDVVGHVDETRPPNYMLIIGDRDQLGTVEQAKRIMSAATGGAAVEEGHTYGDFADGTSRRLEVISGDHATEATSTEVLTALTGWFFESFGLDDPGLVSNPALWRFAGQGAIIAGFLLIALAVVFLLRSYLDRDAGDEDIAPYRPDGRSRGIQLGAASAILFISVSLAAFPFARLTGLRAFVPFFIADLFAGLVVSRTILLVPAVLLIVAVARLKGWKPVRLERPGKATFRELGSSGLIGVAPFAIFVALYAPTAHGLLLSRGFPVSIGWFLALSSILTVQLWAEQEYFHYLFMPVFSPRDTRGKRVTYILSEALVRGVALGAAFIPVSANPFMVIGRQGMLGRFPLVPALVVLGFLSFLPISALAFYARRRGYNVLAPCLAMGLFTALVFTCFFSVRAF